jgi:FHS family glucose/mannose:H+ symporter-like MFS transporter
MNYRYIFLSYSALFILGFIDNSRGPIYPDILELFGIKQNIGSLIFSLSSLMAFIMALLSKFWLKRFGAVNATRFSVFSHLIAVFMMGFCARDRELFEWFLVGNIIFGIGTGIQSITLNIIIGKTTPLETRQKYFAGLHSMYGMASFIAPVVLSGVFYFNWSWQNYFMALAIVPLLQLLISAKTPVLHLNTIKETHPTFNLKTAITLGIILSFYVSTEVMISSRLSVYLNKVWSYGLDESAGQLGLFFMLLLAGRVLFTFYTPKINSVTLMKISASSTLLLLVLGMLVSPKLIALSGVTMSFFFPCMMTWITVQFGEHADDMITIVMRFVGGMIVAMHVLFGQLATMIGLEKAFALAIGLHLVVITLLLFGLHSSLHHPLPVDQRK